MTFGNRSGFTTILTLKRGCTGWYVHVEPPYFGAEVLWKRDTYP